MAQLMPLPLTVSCFSKIQIGFTFLVPAHLGSPGKGPLNWCVCAACLVCGAGSVYRPGVHLSVSAVNICHLSQRAADINRQLPAPCTDCLLIAAGIRAAMCHVDSRDMRLSTDLLILRDLFVTNHWIN